MGNVDRIRDSFNSALDLEGIVLTMYDSRINLSRQVESEIRGFFKEKVFQTVIPRNVALAEAPSHGKPVLSYNAASSGAKAYLDLAKEILANGKESIWVRASRLCFQKKRRLFGRLKKMSRLSLWLL